MQVAPIVVLDVVVDVFHVRMIVRHLAMNYVKIVARVAREHVRVVHRHVQVAHPDVVDVVDVAHVISIVAQQLHNMVVVDVPRIVPVARHVLGTVMVRVRVVQMDVLLAVSPLLLQ